MYITILIWLAILPGLFLLWNTYRQDKIEKEPISLLVKILLLSIVTTIATVIVEVLLQDTVLVCFEEGTYLYHFIDNFLCIALIEEFFKYLAGKIPTWKNKEFNYQFDAVVYMVTSALGFAIYENILYCVSGGIGVAIMRALTSVPSHMIDGIFMGYYYGKAKYADVHGDLAGRKWQTFLALLVPVCLHGFYDFCLSVGSGLAILTFFIFVITLYIVAFKKQKKMAREDVRIIEEELIEIEVPGVPGMSGVPTVPASSGPVGRWDATPYNGEDFKAKNTEK